MIGHYQLPGGKVAAIEGSCPFPPLEQALDKPNGLIAIGGDLSAARILSAYQQGIFPWFSESEPILWWSPDPRMVLFPNELKISRSLAKTLKKHPFELRMNTAFRAVMQACGQTSRPGQDGTWINPQMIEAYCELHAQGYAISSEGWMDGKLVGGCYGVKIGKMFYGESMFHHVTDASKVSFVNLVEHLKTQGVGMIDCQMKTPLLTSFGGREIPRATFLQTLTELVDC